LDRGIHLDTRVPGHCRDYEFHRQEQGRVMSEKKFSMRDE